MTNKEIAKRFAEGARTGKNANGSLFIEGDTIYSYGYHFPLARRDEKTMTAIRNARKYSVTTSKHSGLIGANLAYAGYTVTDEVIDGKGAPSRLNV